MIELVKRLADRGTTVLYSTHYLGEIEDLNARVVIMDHGRVIAEGSVPELMSRNGGTYIELTFEDSIRRIKTANPGSDLAGILTDLGPAAGRLQNVEIIDSSLESVFLELTGRRYEPGEADDVVAS